MGECIFEKLFGYLCMSECLNEGLCLSEHLCLNECSCLSECMFEHLLRHLCLSENLSK
jgi:hypothetical protein